jgi:hypothetical protein
VCYYDATTSSFVAKVQVEVFAHFHAVAIKFHSNMWNWLFCLPGWILCEQSTWCKRKWWACCWLCSSFVSHFPVSVSLNMPFQHPCISHVFLPERLSNHCQGLCCTKFDAHSLFLCQIHHKIASV